MQLAQVQPIAQSLVEQLSSACVRIAIAGSVRRQKPEPQDIEIVAIPSLGRYAVQDLWGIDVEEHSVNHLEDALVTLFDLGEWEFDPALRRNGPRYKRLRHIASGVCCDLFITDARRWGIIYTIRTGPGDFSKALVSFARRNGMFVQDGLLHKHLAEFDAAGEVKPCPAGERCMRIVETPEERDVFKALGLQWLEPKQRQAGFIAAAVPRGDWR